MSSPQDGVAGLLQGASERQAAGGDSGGRGRDRKPGRGLIIAIVAFVFVVIVGAIGFASAGLFGGGSKDYTGPGHGAVVISVKPGDSLTVIGQTLQAAGVVKTTQAFIDAASANPKSTLVAPGSYRMALQMSGALALNTLLNPAARVSHVVVIPEGTRTAGVVLIASKVTGISVAAFEKALSRPATLGLPAWGHHHAEGFLFPATYSIDPGMSATNVLRRMTARFQQSSVALNLPAEAARMGRTPYQVLIVASIIQREVAPRDYAKAARVIYNRLDKGMKLELDSTVAYGLGISRLNLTAADLSSQTPYNTYVINGLPPTPIGNPGDAALTAALHPASGNWIYFVTVNLNTQETRFSSTYAQFLRDKQAFLDWQASHS